jgi:hypothetical protein
MLTYSYHTPTKKSNKYLKTFIGNLSIILILFICMYSRSHTLDIERTQQHIPQWILLHHSENLKPPKYDFVCKLPWTIPSVKSKFRILCKNITMFKFRLCLHRPHMLCWLISFTLPFSEMEHHLKVTTTYNAINAISWWHYVRIGLDRIVEVYFNLLYFLNLITRYLYYIMSLFLLRSVKQNSTVS